MTTAQQSAVGVEEQAPLIKYLGIRVSAVTYAKVVAQSLCEGCSEAVVVRRWMEIGANSEGIDLRSF